jgi:hypothetical protein
MMEKGMPLQYPTIPLKSAPKKKLMGIDQHHRKAHGEQKRIHHPVLAATLAKLAEYQQFGGNPGQGTDDHGRHDGDQRSPEGKDRFGMRTDVFADRGEDIVGHQGADHEVFPVGEHGDVEHPQGQCQAHGHQGRHATGDDGVHQHIATPVQGGQQGDHHRGDDRYTGQGLAPFEQPFPDAFFYLFNHERFPFRISRN